MGVQLVQVGLGERGEPDDPRVVDDPVDAAEGLQGAVDDRLPAVRGGDVARIGDGRATGGDDLLDDRPRGFTSLPPPPIAPPRSFTTTAAPRDASVSAWARPMPRPAPVMTMALPSKRIWFMGSLSVAWTTYVQVNRVLAVMCR